MFSFSQATYNVSEADGVTEVCIQLISNTVTSNVLIEISTQSSSAGCELSHYISPLQYKVIVTIMYAAFDFVMTREFVTFPSASVVGQLRCIQIDIINDDTVEGTETFLVNAVLSDQINAEENQAEVNIFDDDSKDN